MHTASWLFWKDKKKKQTANVTALAPTAAAVLTCPPHRLMLNWRKYLVPLEVKLGPFISDPTDPSSVKSKVRVALPTVCVK